MLLIVFSKKFVVVYYGFVSLLDTKFIIHRVVKTHLARLANSRTISF